MALGPLVPGPIIPGKPTTAKPTTPNIPLGGGTYIKPTTPSAKPYTPTTKPIRPGTKLTTGSTQPSSATADVGASSRTGSIETSIADSSLRSKLGLPEELAIAEAEGGLSSANALRKFQSDQARRQLTDALGAINRAAIEGYKGISEDYAARGLQRSGSYMGAESMAMANTTRAKEQANQALADVLNQLSLEQAAQEDAVAREKQRIMANFIQERLAAGADYSGTSAADKEFKPTGPVYVQRYDGTWGPQYTPAQMKTNIQNATTYLNAQKAKGNAAQVAGAEKKIEEYKAELARLEGKA